MKIFSWYVLTCSDQVLHCKARHAKCFAFIQNVGHMIKVYGVFLHDITSTILILCPKIIKHNNVGVPNQSSSSWTYSYVKTFFCSDKS